MAMVVKEDLHYGIARMTSGLITDEKEIFKPFREKNEALTWLLKK